MKIDENAGPISGPFGCSCLMLFVFYLICVCFFVSLQFYFFHHFLKHVYSVPTRLQKQIQTQFRTQTCTFPWFSIFQQFFPSVSFKISIFFAANLFLFEYVLFLFDYFFVCLFVFAINFVRFLLFSKLKTNPDSTEDSIPDSNLHVSLFFVFQHFSMFFFQNQHCAVNLFFLFFQFSAESMFSLCFS